MATHSALSRFCIYTIRHTSDLREVYKKGGRGLFTENKKWVTGRELFLQSQRYKLRMPIIFAAAEIIDGLIYYGFLTSIDINEDNPSTPITTYQFEVLTPIEQKQPLRALIVKSTRKPLDEDFIRPYAICYTPDFLLIENRVAQDLEALKDEEEFFEGGNTKRRFTNYFERDPKLRSSTILHHGTKCMACGFDFRKTYGEHGEGYIEVHHLVPVHTLKEKTKVNPQTDMAVVCSNCHRMIHRKRDKVLSINDLKALIHQSGGSGGKKTV